MLPNAGFPKPNPNRRDLPKWQRTLHHKGPPPANGAKPAKVTLSHGDGGPIFTFWQADLPPLKPRHVCVTLDCSERRTAGRIYCIGCDARFHVRLFL